MKKLCTYFKHVHRFSIGEELDDITTNLDGAKKNQIVFYRLVSGKEEIFLKRLKDSKAKLILLNISNGKNPFGDNFQPANGVEIIYLSESNFKKTQNDVLDILFPIKSDPEIIGVTGTNGKTSVCYFGLQLAGQLGISALSVGTIGVYDINGKLPTEHRTTTPGHIELHKIISQHNPELILIELSSHALDQGRIRGVEIDAAIWTNFSQDHLDYHKDMENYFHSKMKIFDLMKKNAKLFLNEEETELTSKLISNNKTVELVKNDGVKPDNLVFKMNIYLKNYLVALKSLLFLYPQKNVANFDASKLVPPPGRFDIIKKSNNCYAVVDYAHTPDAVESFLKDVKHSFPDFCLITIVGCGGDRDKLKRSLMGKASCRNSNKVIFTSDNPRSENPKDIINDMTNSLDFKNYEVIVDRKAAIVKAVSSLSSGEMLLVLGKGHEDYQEIDGVRYPFEDKKIVLEALQGLGVDKK